MQDSLPILCEIHCTVLYIASIITILYLFYIINLRNLQVRCTKCIRTIYEYKLNNSFAVVLKKRNEYKRKYRLSDVIVRSRSLPSSQLSLQKNDKRLWQTHHTMSYGTYIIITRGQIFVIAGTIKNGSLTYKVKQFSIVTFNSTKRYEKKYRIHYTVTLKVIHINFFQISRMIIRKNYETSCLYHL